MPHSTSLASVRVQRRSLCGGAADGLMRSDRVERIPDDQWWNAVGLATARSSMARPCCTANSPARSCSPANPLPWCVRPQPSRCLEERTASHTQPNRCSPPDPQSLQQAVHLIWALHASNVDINAGHTEASDTIPTANLLLDDPNIAVGPLPDDTTYYEIIMFVHAVAMFAGWGVLSAIGTDLAQHCVFRALC